MSLTVNVTMKAPNIMQFKIGKFSVIFIPVRYLGGYTIII